MVHLYLAAILVTDLIIDTPQPTEKFLGSTLVTILGNYHVGYHRDHNVGYHLGCSPDYHLGYHLGYHRGYHLGSHLSYHPLITFPA